MKGVTQKNLTETKFMTDKVFIDTNIALYLLSDNEEKCTKTKFLLKRSKPTISVQVVNEFINVCLRKIKLELNPTHKLAEALMAMCSIVAVDEDITRQSMQLAKRYQYSHWDSLIIAAALQSGCSILYSEDMHDGQVIENSLTIINPYNTDKN